MSHVFTDGRDVVTFEWARCLLWNIKHITDKINVGWLEQYVIISNVKFTLNVNSDGAKRYVCLTPQ